MGINKIIIEDKNFNKGARIMNMIKVLNKGYVRGVLK